MTNMLRMTDEQLAEWRAKRGDRRTNAVAQAKALDLPVQFADQPKRASKYGNQKTVVDGITFDSKAEAARWVELKAMEQNNFITDLKRQVRFELVPKGRDSTGAMVRSVAYVADFTYIDIAAYAPSRLVVEDVKGMKTEVYRLKKKLMFHVHGIEIQEIRK